jgi:ribosomal protein L11 methyltransferase
MPPNNGAHEMRLVSDERRARAVADLIVESFEPSEAASCFIPSFKSNRAIGD